MSMEFEERPWGWYKVLLDTPTYKVKEILVKPRQRLSYQLHHKRSEHWYVVQGEATMTLNDKEILLKKGEYIDIPVEHKHRVANRGDKDMTFIEVQTGEYFGEDDIVRFEDDYGRQSSDHLNT
ncbi:MAG TPA: mannose-6-phosphate isomerase [Candidatus Magasanikbacteria bacterium]|nr:MAG: mannose-6-phosphate isomerase [Candidatus Magasanikbacteria bacterium RIFOXYC2_FULL_39_8]HAT03878.1 mannose-6-phosphate isomerase [Candidatus Magasanikbacteria bacterium]